MLIDSSGNVTPMFDKSVSALLVENTPDADYLEDPLCKLVLEYFPSEELRATVSTEIHHYSLYINFQFNKSKYYLHHCVYV